MDLFPRIFLRLYLATIAFLGVSASGSTREQGLLLARPAETVLELLHDNGRLVLSFCMVAFIVLHLCISMFFKATSSQWSTTRDTVSQSFTPVEADSYEDDPLALIVMGLVYGLHGGAFLLCTALAACWQGITCCFTGTMHRFAAAFTPYPSPSLSSSPTASVHPTKPPPASSSGTASTHDPEHPDLWAAASRGGTEATITISHQESWLTRQNQWLSCRLEGVKCSNRGLQKQLQEAHAALLTSRSNAKNAEALAAQAIAERQRCKAALREMKACMEEMYVEGEQAFELFHNEQEILREQLQQERAARVQEEQTHLDQVRSLTAQLSMSQDEASAEQQRSNKLAKFNTQLKQERNNAKSTARAVAAHLKEVVIKQAKADWRPKAQRRLEALTASEKAPGRRDTCRHSRTCPHSDAAVQAKKQDDASSAPNISKPSGMTESIKKPVSRAPFSVISAEQLPTAAADCIKAVNRAPFSVSNAKESTVQAAANMPMSAPSSLAPAAPKQSQACSMTSHMQGAEENVAPAANGFTFGFRPITCPDAGKPLCARASLPMEAKASAAKGQSLSPTTAPEAHSKAQAPSKAVHDSKLSKAALAEPPTTAPEAHSHIKSHMFSKARQNSTLSKAALAEPPTAAPEAHSHVKSWAPSKAVHDSELSKAALAKSLPAALAAANIKAVDSSVSTTAAAESSTAITRQPPATATEADNIKAVDCKVSTIAAATAESSTATTRQPPATATEADNMKAVDCKISTTAAATAESSTATTRQPLATATEADNIRAVDCKVSTTAAATAESSTATTRQPPATATEADNMKAVDCKVSTTAAATAESSTATTRQPPATAIEADNMKAVDCKVSTTAAATAESSTANTRQPPATTTEADNRLDEADLSLMTLARRYRVKHSRMRRRCSEWAQH